MITQAKPAQAITKLTKAPLVHVLAQVRYAPVLAVSRSIPGIQEGLRKAGFPRFEKSEAQNIILSPGAVPRVDTVERWDFLSRDKRIGVVLTPAFVVVHTNLYDTFTVFSDTLRKVFDVVSAEIDIEIVERIGIRYVDLVRLDDGEYFTDYLKPGLVGFPFSDISDESITQTASVTQSVAQLPEQTEQPASTLTVRCIQSNNGNLLPPDLTPTVLHYDLTLKPGEVVTMLDFDHYTTLDTDFAPGSLVSSLDSLHRVANKAFRIALKPFAYEKWGGDVA